MQWIDGGSGGGDDGNDDGPTTASVTFTKERDRGKRDMAMKLYFYRKYVMSYWNTITHFKSGKSPTKVFPLAKVWKKN